MGDFIPRAVGATEKFKERGGGHMVRLHTYLYISIGISLYVYLCIYTFFAFTSEHIFHCF